MSNQYFKSIKARRLMTIRNTLIQMCEARGYETKEQEKNYETFINDYCIKNNEELDYDINKTKLNFIAYDGDDIIHILFIKEIKLTIGIMIDLIKKLKSENIKHVILIISSSPSQSVKNIWSNMAASITIEMFHEDELMYNILRHKLSPKQRLIRSNEEKKKILDLYKVKENAFPRQDISDPVSRFLGAKSRDIIEIIRISETSGAYLSYRIVV